MKLARGVAVGLQHLHQNGIIHRDLAARNVLLDIEYEAVVSDFGLARVVKDAQTGGITTSGTGPLKWMSPQAMIDRVYNERSDIWSFGCFLCELMTREEPYGDMDPVQVATNVALGTLKPTVPDTSDSKLMIAKLLLDRCTAYEPNDRPSIEDIIDELS